MYVVKGGGENYCLRVGLIVVFGWGKLNVIKDCCLCV